MNKTITINRDEFFKKSSELMANNEKLKELFKSQPTLMLVTIMFSAELEKVLFEGVNADE